jgi:uncharacterized Fe-S cluster-containing radical SAM superfamily protein
VSNAQDKKEARIAEAQDFVSERRRLQLQMLEQNFDTGVRLYEAQKDTLSPEDIEKIEEMMAQQRAALDKLHDEAYPRTQA